MEIIVEIGQNHNGDMELACELINMAKECGAHVAKFQLFDTDTVFRRENNMWYDYNVRAQITREQLCLLDEECKKVDIEFMASVFDVERVKWLEEIGVKRYKIASRSVYDEELVNAIVETGKPIIMSLGHWQGTEFPKINSISHVDFLYCISEYPTDLDCLKLKSVDFSKYAGFSDHTVGLTAAIAAISLGARIIEKHFTADKTLYGPDHSCSMTPEELRRLNNFCNEYFKCF